MLAPERAPRGTLRSVKAAPIPAPPLATWIRRRLSLEDISPLQASEIQMPRQLGRGRQVGDFPPRICSEPP